MKIKNIKKWWDGRNANSFFSTVYMLGDDSFEGYLDCDELTIEQRTQRECNMVESYLKLHPGNTILDCPCGYGRHSLELAKREYNVVGIDLCQAFISKANHQAMALPYRDRCRFLLADMRSLPPGLGTFDACLNMFLSFGFFNHEDNYLVLQEFYRVLRPGGQLFIHSDVNPDLIREGLYGDRRVRTLRDGSILYINEHYNSVSKRLIGSWSIQNKSNRVINSHYSIRIYEHQEMINMFKLVGFQGATLYYPQLNHACTNKTPSQEVIYVAIKAK